MSYRISGVDYRGRFAETIEHGLARRWLAQAPDMYDHCRPMPAAPRKQSVALLGTPLGTAVAKKVSRKKPRLVRNWRANRLYDLALRLGSAGVETALPWAVLLPRRGRWPSLLLLEYLEIPTALEWLRAGAPGDRALVARELADTVARLHLRRLRHRDLKSPNLLLDPAPPVRIVVLDLDGIRPRIGRGPIPIRSRGRDLARLRLSLMLAPEAEIHDEVWGGILARYAERLGDDPAEIEEMSRRWAEEHAEENRARGRPTV